MRDSLGIQRGHRMNRRVLLRGLAICLFAAPASGQQGTDSSWANPDVWRSHSVSVRIEMDIHQRKLRAQTDSAVCYGGAVHITATLFTDHKGHVRKYVLEGGGDDSYVTVWYYYDTDGALRKTVSRVGAVNGTAQNTNFYFDSKGTLIGKTNTLISGPGFPNPADSAIKDPLANFRSLCGPPTQSVR